MYTHTVTHINKEGDDEGGESMTHPDSACLVNRSNGSPFATSSNFKAARFAVSPSLYPRQVQPSSITPVSWKQEPCQEGKYDPLWPNSGSSYTYTLSQILAFAMKTYKTLRCLKTRSCMSVCGSVTFSLATLWEKGHVPSACLHVPRRNLHINNRNKPENAEANRAAKGDEKLVLGVL